jgi:hypothetical protein
MKVMATRLAAAFLLGLIPAAGHAQDFAADVVYIATKPASKGTAAPPGHSSKLYVGKDKMRLEAHGLADTILLVNAREQTAIVVFPLQKAYQQLANTPTEYFRVEDAENACPDWAKAANQKIVCEKVGADEVDGRRALKYQNKGASDAGIAAVWIDVALKFVIKWEGVSTGAELKNIREGQQRADLFAVPSDYKVLKPQTKASRGFSQR